MQERTIVENLVVEIAEGELTTRFEAFARKCDQMSFDIESGQGLDWLELDGDEGERSKERRRRRAIGKLHEAASSARFIAQHLVRGATYRLDAEGAAQLVRDTLPDEDSLADAFALRRWRIR